MLLHLFAGSVISDELYYTLIAGALVVVIAGLTLAVFIFKKVLSSKKTFNNKQVLRNSLILSTIVILASALIFFVIPTMIKDAQWERKQSDCANKTGHSRYDFVDPDTATPDSYFMYNECLDN